MFFSNEQKIIARHHEEQRTAAMELINEALANCKSKGDYSYIIGLVDLAYKVGVIEMNERADINCKAAELAGLTKKK